MDVTAFHDRYLAACSVKRSVLCVGLDPALPDQRPTQALPARYLEAADVNAARLNFCLDLIESTQEFCCAYKPNQQYIAGFTTTDHQALTTAIAQAGALSILDYKLNDIGDTVDAALYHLHHWGYDAVTFNPFLGNLHAAVDRAHHLQPAIGVIVLTLTSNREAPRYQKEAQRQGKALYLTIAEDIKTCNADGCVVGATGHITTTELTHIRTIVGDDTIFLVPGVGTQRGDPQKVIRACGPRLLINVGRDIIYSPDPQEKANQYNRLFNDARGHS
jgi:orotidine 5'-phosphate decarboxylase subfamily 2